MYQIARNHDLCLLEMLNIITAMRSEICTVHTLFVAEHISNRPDCQHEAVVVIVRFDGDEEE